MSSTSLALTVARRMARATWVGAAGYGIIVVAAAIVADALTGTFGELRTSIAQYPVLISPKYFLMVFGIYATTSQLPVFVAHGVTRRVFARGAAVFLAGAALVFAVAQVGVLVVEFWVFDALGVAGRLTVPHPAGTPGHAGRLFVECLFLGLSYAVFGWLVGAGYYRYSTYVATLLILPFSIPVLVGETAFGTWDYGGDTIDGARLPLAVLIVLALVGGGWWLCLQLTRTVALRKITS